MFGLRTSKGCRDGDVGVEENHERMCRWLWVWQPLTLKCFARVFSLKNTPFNSWVMGVYIVWVKNLVKHFPFFQTENFASTSWDGLSCEVLANLMVWHDSLASSHVLHTWPFHGLLYLQASHELVANFTDLLLMLDSLLISHTHPLQLNSHKYKKMIEWIITKFGTKLKPTKAS